VIWSVICSYTLTCIMAGAESREKTGESISHKGPAEFRTRVRPLSGTLEVKVKCKVVSALH
jgi:hypothetical protein